MDRWISWEKPTDRYTDRCADRQIGSMAQAFHSVELKLRFVKVPQTPLGAKRLCPSASIRWKILLDATSPMPTVLSTAQPAAPRQVKRRLNGKQPLQSLSGRGWCHSLGGRGW